MISLLIEIIFDSHFWFTLKEGRVYGENHKSTNSNFGVSLLFMESLAIVSI